MQAEIIAVGSELLTASKVDTNSLFLTRKLGERGIPLVRKCVVGDERSRLAQEIRRARDASELVILCGGLGPTLDDLTRDAAADATGRSMILHDSVVLDIQARFRSFNRPMAEVNKRQAYILEGAEILRNRRGTAPGQWLEDERGVLILLPGPPRELEPLFEESCLPLLERLIPPSQRFFTQILRVAGIGESDVEQRVGPIYIAEPRVATTILSSPGDIQIHLVAQADNEERARMIATRLGDRIREELRDAVYSLDGEPLDSTVVKLVRERGWKLAVAESCTGGLLAGRLTEIPGSSEIFAGGIVSYCNQAKRTWLEVDSESLCVHGAVSEQSAAAMAQHARNLAAQALGEPAAGVSITGYAGPGGGTARDPVGTVYFGIASTAGVGAHRRHLGGDRRRVRDLAVQTALDLLRRHILGLSAP